MLRKIRRKRQALPAKEVSVILHQGISGALVLPGGDDYPYAIPISYVFDSAKLHFRYTKDGHKPDAIQRSSKVSFCVIGQDRIVPEKHTTYFRNVIAFGQIRTIRDEKERRVAIEKLAKKYPPDEDTAGRRREIDREWKALCMPEVCIDHMTGRGATELMKKRQKGS